MVNMRNVYIAINYGFKDLMLEELECIKSTCASYSLHPIIFVNDYPSFINNQEMMKQAFEDIDKSDILIAELSNKATGVGIEIGYAVAKKKPIIYLRKSGVEESPTVSGIAGYQFEYSSIEDLNRKLNKILHLILK